MFRAEFLIGSPTYAKIKNKNFNLRSLFRRYQLISLSEKAGFTLKLLSFQSSCVFFSENSHRYAPTQMSLRLRIFKMMRQRYDRPINRFRIEHWLQICKKINKFFYSLRYYAYAKFENLEFWITWIVDKLHIKLMLFACTVRKLSSKGRLRSLKVTFKFRVIFSQI